MLKSFGIGVLIVLILFILSLVMRDMNLLMQYTTMSGIISMVIAAVIAGVLGSGDRIRANYTHEESDERKERVKLALYFMMISIPNLVTAVIMYLFQNFSR
ncbi:DUF5316 domain-containing protein [Thermicanus aegyptius]|uniref:DUF5316 domain-containing protein n=1 Tax=Thermicanus aegyptius TaxID=94009 RepID=UPI0003F4C617|nr:DUF5316 domain-containing protein [Thermicanus aegyptius]